MNINKYISKRDDLLLSSSSNEIIWIGAVVLPYRQSTTEKLKNLNIEFKHTTKQLTPLGIEIAEICSSRE